MHYDPPWAPRAPDPVHDTPIYLDHQATTPVDPRVLEAMLPVFHRDFGNAASRTHRFGWRAEELVERARADVAAAIGARPSEIVFTSGATEALNLALKGVAERAPEGRRHLVTSAAEHSAVLDTVAYLESKGFEVTRLAPSDTGRVSAEAVAEALRDDTLLVALMWANNEVGTLNPVHELGALCRERGVLFLTDATQAVGKLPVDMRAASVDLASMSAHKLYGPKGCGALFVRRGRPTVHLAKQRHGGGHEHGLRSGTLNVPGIVGLGTACRIADEELEEEARRLTRQRDGLEAALCAGLQGVHLNGDRDHRLPGCLHLSFDGVAAEDVMRALPGVALSTGSACGSGSPDPSHVLRAMGVPDDRAYGSLRFGLGRYTTDAELAHVARRLIEVVDAHRAETRPAPGASSGASPGASPTASPRVHS